jgi:hypothetical protein
LARIRRARLRVEAPSAEKNTNRLDAGALRGPDQPPGRDAGQFLDRAVGLIADHRGHVHDGFDTAERVPEGQMIGQISERDLHANPLDAESPRVAHQTAHRDSRRRQPSQQRHPDRPRGSSEQQHRGEAAAAAGP